MIRPAIARDAQQIADIWNVVIRDTAHTFNTVEKSTNDITKLIEQGQVFIVAAQGETVLGFATYSQFRGGVGYAHTMEHSIHLVADAQGQGVGRALMDALCATAKSQDVHSLWAGVSSENPSGVAFHAALGFDTIATLPEVGRKFDRWMDLILMQKRL